MTSLRGSFAKKAVVTTLLMLFHYSPTAFGQIEFDGDVDLSWNNAANWNGNVKPGASDHARITNAGHADGDTITLDGNQTVNKFSIRATEAFTLGPGTGGTLTLNSGDLDRVNIPSSSNIEKVHTIGANVVLGNTDGNGLADWNINGSNGLVVTGSISGTPTLYKDNNAYLDLAGSNTFTGGVQIKKGTLIVSAADAIPSGDILFLSGGPLVSRADRSLGTSTIKNNKKFSTLSFESVDQAQDADIIISGANGDVRLNMDVDSGITITWNGDVSHDPSSDNRGEPLTKKGGGTLVFTGSNTYGDKTEIQAGRFLVNGTHIGVALTGNSNNNSYEISKGAFLGGTGTIDLASGSFTFEAGTAANDPGGFAAPGASTGTLTLEDNANFQDYGGIEFEWASLGDQDLLDVNATMSIGDNFIIDVIDLSMGTEDPDGTDLLVATADALSLNGPNFIVNLPQDWTFDGVSTDDNSLTLLNVDNSALSAAEIPEPSTIAIWMLLGLVAAGFAWRKRYR